MTIAIDREPTLRDLFEQIALRLGIHPDDPSETILELVYKAGTVHRAHIHRKLGHDQLDHMGESAA